MTANKKEATIKKPYFSKTQENQILAYGTNSYKQDKLCLNSL